MRERIITGEKLKHLELDVPVCVQTGTAVGEVLLRMQRNKQSCVLVCSANRCIGIFTERDFLNKVLGKSIGLSRSVDDFMSADPKTLTMDDTVGQAIHIMNKYGYRNVPLVDQKGDCTGLLRIRNIIGYLAELFPEEVLNVPSHSLQQFSEPDGA